MKKTIKKVLAAVLAATMIIGSMAVTSIVRPYLLKLIS